MEQYLRTQVEILADVRNRMRDGSSSRWTDTEIYRALNDALLTWHGRVGVPHVYTIPGGWIAGQYAYALPTYINANTCTPQMRRVADGYVRYLTNEDTWEDVPGWRIEPDSNNNRVMRFDVSPYSTDARILWYGFNGPVPTTVPTLKTAITGTATSLTLNGQVDCGDYGWLKIDDELIQFSGRSGETDITLSNLVRACTGGGAALPHSANVPVKFGVAFPKTELFRVLLDQMFVFLHELYLSDGSPRELTHHQQMIGFYTDRVSAFWRNWTPIRQPRIIIDRRFLL
jgi:hypothetical protein